MTVQVLRATTVLSTKHSAITTAPNRGMSPELKAVLAANACNVDADYTIKQVLAWSGMSASAFYRMLKAGTGPRTIKRGRATRIKGCDYRAWRDAQ